MPRTKSAILSGVTLTLILGILAGCPPRHLMHSPDGYLRRYATGVWRLDRDGSAELIAAAPEPPTATIAVNSEGSSIVREPGRNPSPDEIARRLAAIRQAMDGLDIEITLNEDHTGRYLIKSEDSSFDMPFLWEAPPGFRRDRSIYPIITSSETGEEVPTLGLVIGDSVAGDQLRFRVLPLHWTIVLRRER